MNRFAKPGFKAFLRYILFSAMFLAALMICSQTGVYADDDEGDDWVYYKGVANGRVNVRTGPGEEYDKIVDANKKAVQLVSQEEVIIIGEAKANSGKLWYKIRFTHDGVEYEGFSTSSYVSKDDTFMITPSPTPSPSPTPTPSPSPTPKPTEAITAPTGALIDEEPSNNDKDDLMRIILFVILAASLFLIALIVLRILRSRKGKGKSAASKKVDKLKKMNLDNKDGSRKLPQIKKIEDDSPVAEEVRQDVYYKKTYDYSESDELLKSAEKESDEKKALRAAIDRLQEHDIVYHVIYGEGEVFDNSDVKLLEVRFGNDMRFLKKDQLVAKHELQIVDEEEQAIAKRRNRKKNKIN